jgi:hypothetical protein
MPHAFVNCLGVPTLLWLAAMNAYTPSITLQCANRRHAPSRSRSLKTGKLLYGGVTPVVIDCLIVDLSEAGARVETPTMTSIPVLLRLRSGDGPERHVRRCWAQGNEIGLEFLDEAGQGLS